MLVLDTYAVCHVYVASYSAILEALSNAESARYPLSATPVSEDRAEKQPHLAPSDSFLWSSSCQLSAL